MNTLKFSILAIPERGLSIDSAVPLERCQPRDAEALPIRDARIHGNLAPVGGDYLFRGGLSYVIERPCDRCLQMLAVPLEIELTWVFQEAAPAGIEVTDEEEQWAVDIAEQEDSSIRLFRGVEIEFCPYIWEELVLSLPGKHVCGADRAEECPYYGAPVEQVSGEAEVSPRESAFSKLKEMFPELKQESEE